MQFTGALVLLLLLSAHQAVAPIGSSRGCRDGCGPIKPKGCCSMGKYKGCTKQCDNHVPRYCFGGQCVECPWGTYMKSKGFGDKNYGGKEQCSVAPKCPAGTFYPVDKFGLFARRTSSGASGQVSSDLSTLTPCVKCGQSNADFVTGPNPTVSATSGFYQPESGKNGTTSSSDAGYGCSKCPDGEQADMQSCLDIDGVKVNCQSGVAVTGPTACKKCPSSTPYTNEAKNRNYDGGVAQCLSESACASTGAAGGWPTGKRTVGDNLCEQICPSGKWLEYGQCISDANCDSDPASLCRDPAPGTYVDPAKTRFECACKQKYNDQVITTGSDCADCKSKVADSTIANSNGVGTSADISGGISNPKNGDFYRPSDTIDEMTKYWCDKPGYASTSEDGTGCTQCEPGTASGGDGSKPGNVASEYIESESRFKYAMEGSDSPPSCSPCDSGKYSGFGAMTCGEDCPPGSMLSGTDCTSCPVGQFSAVANSKECTVCPEGKFSGAPYTENMDDEDGPGLNYEKSLNVSGATRCGVCYHQKPSENKGFNGYRVVEISRGVANCSLCPAGKHVYFGQENKGRLSNKNKDGGFFENLAFQGSDVRSWMYGQWNEASDPDLFPAATCAKCEPGKFSNESTMLAGIDGEDRGGSEDCIACPWNSVPSPLQDSCVRCPEGTTSAPVGMFPIEHVDKAGTACRSVGSSVVALVFNFLFAIAYTVYACTDDRFCFNKCKSKTRVNVPAKVIAVVWMFWGLLTLSFNLLLVDALVCCFFPFVFLFCTSFCVMCGKSMKATERDMLTKKVVVMSQEGQKANGGSM